MTFTPFALPLMNQFLSEEWVTMENPRTLIDVAKTDVKYEQQKVHCILCTFLDNDIPQSKIISAHLTEAGAQQLLQRLQTVADPTYTLEIHSVILEQ